MVRTILTLIAAIHIPALAVAAQGPAAVEAAKRAGYVCKWVVTEEEGAKPFEMCMSKAQWTAKEIEDAKDPNRMVCRIGARPDSRVGAQKTCKPASQWAEDQRLEQQQIQDLQMRTCVAMAGC